MIVVDKLFALLRQALWGEPFRGELSNEEFMQVMNLGKEQTVYGLLFDAISQLSGRYDKRQVLEAYGRTEKIKRQNELINKELKEMILMLDKHSIDCLVVKGQTIGLLYPKSALRMAGDIDFLIQQQYSSVKNVIENQFAVSLPARMIEREIEFTHGGVLYELHTSLRDWAKKRHQKVWDTLMEKEWEEKYCVEIEGVSVRTLSPTLNVAYVFIHLFFHFIREGVSLRQLCDWAMVLHHYKNEIDKDKLLEILLDLDMFDAYCAFGTILTDRMGLPAEEFPFPLGDNARKWQEKILKDIFGGGNFGKLHHQAHQSWKFKVETLRLVLRNTFKYYQLCPSEVGGVISRLVKANLKILFCKVKN